MPSAIHLRALNLASARSIRPWWFKAPDAFRCRCTPKRMRAASAAVGRRLKLVTTLTMASATLFSSTARQRDVVIVLPRRLKFELPAPRAGDAHPRRRAVAIPPCLGKLQTCGTGRNGTGRRGRPVPPPMQRAQTVAGLYVFGGDLDGFGEIRPLAVDDVAGSALDCGSVSGEDRRGRRITDARLIQPLQRSEVNFHIHISASILILIEPSSSRQRHLKSDNPHGNPTTVTHEMAIARSANQMNLGESLKSSYDYSTLCNSKASLLIPAPRGAAQLDVLRCHSDGLNEAGPFSIDNAPCDLLDQLPVTRQRRLRDVRAGGRAAQSQQCAHLHLDIDKPVERLVVVRPSRPVEGHLKGDGAGAQPMDIGPVHFSSRFQRVATSSITRNARSSKPSGTATRTSQLCAKGQCGPAKNGRRKSRSRSSSFALRLAATRSSSSRISSALCCDLLKARPSANADRASIG
ncbi:hypothetical protein SAMN03159338_4248 [Sphingomonas sp. NFR04]|nr:hypothetical protein SAMN03159338_4248 [Sphingomonas sp. NFR04]